MPSDPGDRAPDVVAGRAAEAQRADGVDDDRERVDCRRTPAATSASCPTGTNADDANVSGKIAMKPTRLRRLGELDDAARSSAKTHENA